MEAFFLFFDNKDKSAFHTLSLENLCVNYMERLILYLDRLHSGDP